MAEHLPVMLQGWCSSGQVRGTLIVAVVKVEDSEEEVTLIDRLEGKKKL
jgi:hypothetical protein